MLVSSSVVHLGHGVWVVSPSLLYVWCIPESLQWGQAGFLLPCELFIGLPYCGEIVGGIGVLLFVGCVSFFIPLLALHKETHHRLL